MYASSVLVTICPTVWKDLTFVILYLDVEVDEACSLTSGRCASRFSSFSRVTLYLLRHVAAWRSVERRPADDFEAEAIKIFWRRSFSSIVMGRGVATEETCVVRSVI